MLAAGTDPALVAGWMLDDGDGDDEAVVGDDDDDDGGEAAEEGLVAVTCYEVGEMTGKPG